MKKNKNLSVLVLVMVINALGFGIIVPLMYPFSKQFGITEQTLGYLIASFSIAQFIATPILGSLSDKYGRKPILVISLIGTTISFIMFAEARSALMLFAARTLDGITGGNISVAQAVISDSTTAEERTKAFGVLGASFGFGFMVGPALGGVLSKISLFFPFYFAAGLALLGALVTWFFLKETNVKAEAVIQKKRNFLNVAEPFYSLKKPVVGTVIFIGFLLAVAQFSMIVGFQTFNVDILKLTPFEIGLFFAGFAVAGIIMQLFGLKVILKKISSKVKILCGALVITSLALLLSAFANSFLPFALCIMFYGLFNALRDPMLNSLITERTPQSEQGKILGINQSYLSIGQIVGPVLAGFVSIYSIHSIFVLSSAFVIIALIFAFRLYKRQAKVSI